jgi:hypothetical protein
LNLSPCYRFQMTAAGIKYVVQPSDQTSSFVDLDS